MDELARIRAIKKDKKSRAYVTGLHSTPAGIEAANLLLRHIRKKNDQAFFALIVFPDIDRLLSQGSFAAVKYAWPVMAKRLSKYLPTKSLCTQTQFGLFIQVWDGKAAQKLFDEGLEKLMDDLNQPFQLIGSGLQGSASLSSHAGYLLVKKENDLPKDAEALLASLAIAATSANQSAQRLRHFCSSLQKSLIRQEYSISNLPKALQQNQIDLRFHPQFLNRGRSICGAQVKIFWQDAQHGVFTHSEIKNACSITGALPQITQFMIDRSASFLKKLQEEGSLLQDFRLSISIPFEIFQCREFNLYSELTKTLQSQTVKANNIRLEFEGCPEFNSAQRSKTLNCLKKLRSLGIDICMSFGNKMPDLSILAAGVVSHMKWQPEISGVSKARDQKYQLGTLIAIAKLNHIKVIIGGISQSGQMRLLASHRIDMFQGSLFSEPLSETGFTNFLNYSMEKPGPIHNEPTLEPQRAMASNQAI